MVFAAGAVAHAKSCQSAGGMLMTDLGAVDANTTMGIAAGGSERRRGRATGSGLLKTVFSASSDPMHLSIRTGK
jgi:hypothetical protein